MKVRDKPWLALPFLGSQSRPNHEIEHNESYGAPINRSPYKPEPDGDRDGDATDFDRQLTRQQTALDFSKKDEEDIVKDFNSPIHMWVITTLFPLVAGTFGPMASMFNICAIAISWRIIVAPGSKESNGQHIPDPHWLVGVNIVSLVIAILANLSLLGQMTNRIRYNISAPITIVGFYLSGLVDIGLVAAASQHLPLPDNPNATYSQAFYYAALSGAIYFTLALMLSVTAIGIWMKHYSDEFKLSLSQRSLMLQTILFLAYVLASGGIYSKVENWTYLDANYFVIVTLFTIGFGDLTPKTHLGRSLFFPFAVGGILFVGVIIANIRTLVLESGSVKVSTRLVEKARHQAIKTGKPEEGIVKLRGMRRRDLNAPTEVGRREKEFEVMRAIQVQAAHNNRLFALGFAGIAFMILWFIGAVAFWKAESESVGGQSWSYFESLYFTFVAQVTIGYGDFEPQTNSAKPAFVFWALIALPTLTVLIGAIGDAVSDFVNWYTLWVGNHTHDLWKIIKAIWTKDTVKNAAKEAQKKALKEDEVAEDGFERIANIERSRTVPLDFKMDGLSEFQAAVAEETYRPFIMLKAAHKILDHLDADPPRQYTFQEWTWLLKLLGEDENDKEGHRRVGSPLPNGAEIVTPMRQEPHHVWSWIGQESPLMNLEDGSEPRWVLKRLMWSLEKNLKERADRHIEEKVGLPPTAEGPDTVKVES